MINKIDNYRNHITYITLLLISFFISFYLIGDNLKSSFSVIDDHRVVERLTYEEFSLNSLVEQYKEIEEFNEPTGRFRPSFQLGYLLEVFFFGEQIYLYYLNRITIFALFISIISYYFCRFTNLQIGVGLSVIALSETYWFDIFSRIIVSEVHVIFGLIFFIPASIYIFDYLKNLHQKNNYFYYLIIITFLISGIYIIGSKENFLFLILVPIYFLYLILKNKKKFYSLRLICIIFLMFSFWVCYKVGIYFLISESTSFENLKSGYINFSFEGAKLIFQSINNLTINHWFLGYLLTPHIFFFFYGYYSGTNSYILAITKRSILFILIVISVVFFQILFYSKTSLPSDTRYDFPNSLLFLIILANLFIYYEKIINHFCKRNILVYGRIFFLLIILFFIIQKNTIQTFKDIKFNSVNHVNNTLVYDGFLDELENYSKLHEEFPVIIESYDVWDYELISSIYKFSKFRGIKNRIMLKLNYVEDDYTSDIEKLFVKRLESISFNNADWAPANKDKEWGFNELNEDISKKQCISVEIRSRQTDRCQIILFFEYSGR